MPVQSDVNIYSKKLANFIRIHLPPGGLLNKLKSQPHLKK
jgi:hypothetical protein